MSLPDKGLKGPVAENPLIAKSIPIRVIGVTDKFIICEKIQLVGKKNCVVQSDVVNYRCLICFLTVGHC